MLKTWKDYTADKRRANYLDSGRAHLARKTKLLGRNLFSFLCACNYFHISLTSGKIAVVQLVLNFRKSLLKKILLTQYCAGDKIKKIEMGGTCGTYGGREWCAQDFGGQT